MAFGSGPTQATLQVSREPDGSITGYLTSFPLVKVRLSAADALRLADAFKLTATGGPAKTQVTVTRLPSR